jgi:hypothetical protein
MEYVEVTIQFYNQILLDTMLKILDEIDYECFQRIVRSETNETCFVVKCVDENIEELMIFLFSKLSSLPAIKVFDIEVKQMPESFKDNLKSLGMNL